MSPFQNAGLFLVQALFNAYIFILLLRIVLQKCRLDFYNPLSQWVFKMTNPLLMPLQRYMPHYGGFDLPAASFLLLLQFVKFTLMVLLESGLIPTLTGLIIVSFADTLMQLINLYFYAMLFLIIVSWVNPLAVNPVAAILSRLTEPLVTPFRRFMPVFGGIDLTPMFVLLGLKLVSILVADPLIVFGNRLL